MKVIPVLEDIKQNLSFYAAGVWVNHEFMHWSTKIMAVDTLDVLEDNIYHPLWYTVFLYTLGYHLLRVQRR